MIVDARNNKPDKVSGYSWSDGGEYIRREGKTLVMKDEDGDVIADLCWVDDLDNFIKALKLAKEMK